MKTKLTFTGEGGWDTQKAHAKAILEVGKQYTFIGGEMHSSITYYELEEVPGQQFNSTLFAHDENSSAAFEYLSVKFESKREKDFIEMQCILIINKILGSGKLTSETFKRARRFGNSIPAIKLSILLIKHPELDAHVSKHVHGYQRKIKEIENSISDVYIKTLALDHVRQQFKNVVFDERVSSYVENLIDTRFKVAYQKLNLQINKK